MGWRRRRRYKTLHWVPPSISPFRFFLLHSKEKSFWMNTVFVSEQIATAQYKEEFDSYLFLPAKGDFTFGNIPPCDITLQMYTLLMDGVPVNTSRPATYKQNSTLSITDVFYGAEYLIPWRIFPDVAISESPLIKGISVDDLLRLEYITPSKGG